MQSPPLPPPPGDPGAAYDWGPLPPVPHPTPAYSGFWRRALSWLIDRVLVGVVAIIVDPSGWRAVTDAANRWSLSRSPADLTELTRQVGPVALLMVVIWSIYQVIMIGAWGATVGKFAVGVRVRKVDGSTVAWREASLRPLLQLGVSLLSLVAQIGILSLVDYLWMLWDRQKQTLHDKLAGTIVVRV